MTIDDMVGAVKTFLDFLDMAEYPNPVRLVACRPGMESCESLNKESLATVLEDYWEWLSED